MAITVLNQLSGLWLVMTVHIEIAAGFPPFTAKSPGWPGGNSLREAQSRQIGEWLEDIGIICCFFIRLLLTLGRGYNRIKINKGDSRQYRQLLPPQKLLNPPQSAFIWSLVLLLFLHFWKDARLVAGHYSFWGLSRSFVFEIRSLVFKLDVFKQTNLPSPPAFMGGNNSISDMEISSVPHN